MWNQLEVSDKMQEAIVVVSRYGYENPLAQSMECPVCKNTIKLSANKKANSLWAVCATGNCVSFIMGYDQAKPKKGEKK